MTTVTQTQSEYENALGAYWQAQARLERVSMAALTHTIRALRPHAAALDLDYSDQGDYYYITAVLDADGHAIADAEDLLDTSADIYVSNLNIYRDYAFITTTQSPTRAVLDLELAHEWARAH